MRFNQQPLQRQSPPPRAKHRSGVRRGRTSKSSWRKASAITLAMGVTGVIMWPLLSLSSAAEPPKPTALGADGGTVPSYLPLPPGSTPQSSAVQPNGSSTAYPFIGVSGPSFPTGALGTAGIPGVSTPSSTSASASASGSPQPTGVVGIPSIVLQAYERAATTIAGADPACHLTWQDLAGIGKIESDHAGNGQVTADGTASPPILGPVLDGSNGNAAIPDTDQGRWDGDTTWDRAVGPMQFIPSTWVTWAATDRPGVTAPDPENVFDASLASGHYLCSSGGDLGTQQGLDAAIMSYNHSSAYVSAVEAWITSYGSAGSAPSSSNSPAPVASAPSAGQQPVAPTASAPAATSPGSPNSTPQPKNPPPTSHAPSPSGSTPASTPASAPKSTPPAPPSTTAGSTTTPPPSTTTAPVTTAPASSTPASPSPASTTVTLTVSPTGSATAGAPVTLTANVTPAAGGSVTFTDTTTGTTLGTATVTSGAASLTVTTLAQGAHSLTASFTPTGTTAYTASLSAPVPLTITADPSASPAGSGTGTAPSATTATTTPSTAPSTP